MPILLLGIVLAVFGLASVVDADRITTSLRLPGVFDLMGPDRYLLAVGIGLLLLAATLIFQGARSLRTAGPREVAAADPEDNSQVHLWLLGVLVLYALLMPITGYMIATFLFFLGAFRVMGVSTWRWSLIAAVLAAASFILTFIVAADMTFPRGWFNIG